MTGSGSWFASKEKEKEEETEAAGSGETGGEVRSTDQHQTNNQWQWPRLKKKATPVASAFELS